MLKYFSDKNKYIVDEPSLWTINGSVDIQYAGGTKHESGKLTVQVGNIESYVPIEKDTISPYIPPTNSDDENNNGVNTNPEPGSNEPGTSEEPGDTPINPGTSDGNPVININVNITNATSSSVQLDGRLRFVLGNPNQDGSWFAGWSGGPYIRTDNIYFSSSPIILGAGETRTFSGLTWQDADSGCGLGGASPLNSNYLPVYADDGSIAYAGNVLMYTDGRSDTTLCQNLSSSIIFTNGETYNLTITSHS